MKTLVFAATYLLWFGGWQCHEGFFSSLFFFLLYLGMLWLAWQQTFLGSIGVGCLMKALQGPTGLVMNKWIMTPIALVVYFVRLNEGRTHEFGYFCDAQTELSGVHLGLGLIWVVWTYYTLKRLAKSSKKDGNYEQ